MENTKQAIALGNNHWTKQRNGEYMTLMKDPDLQPLWKVMRRADSSKVSATFQAPTHVFLLNSRTHQMTDKSHMKELSLTASLTKHKNNV
jgi:hypothetical protein